MEARMAAQAEVHGFPVPVFYPKGHSQRAADQRIADGKGKYPGIALIGLLVRAKAQHHGGVRFFREGKAPVWGDAVDIHGIRLAIQLIAPVR